MKAEYNHWYKCQEGTMPEDFENVLIFPKFSFFPPEETKEVVVLLKSGEMSVDYRQTEDTDYGWGNFYWLSNKDVLAWMLPAPYKE